MKKISVAIVLLLAFLGFSFFEEKTKQANLSSSASTTNVNSATTPSLAYKDGTYTGDSTDAYYGNVQVQATISGGKLTNVTFLQYPNDRGESVQINNQAMPVLTQEAIQTQGGNVDTVSGATQTSEAFVQSLHSALAKAK